MFHVACFKKIMSKKSLRLEIVQKTTELATAGFGFVAALAWNDAVQALVVQIFGEQSRVMAKFLYAVILTIAVVLITTQLGRLADKFKNE